MKSNSVLFVFSLLFIAFAGCDYVDSRAIDREREDSIYMDAMAEYAAGRMDKAIAGLQRVVRANPANSSARFQLACLLQDVDKDYLGAICNYREFLTQDKSGDKSSLANDRIIQCERALGPELVKKYDLGGTAALAGENAGLKERVAVLEKEKSDLQKRLDRAIALADENSSEADRMRRMLTGAVADDSKRSVAVTEASLLDGDDDEKPTVKEGAKYDPIKSSEDVDNLVFDKEPESASTPFAVTDKKRPEKKNVDNEPPHEPRPPEYVVQDGDTLYKLAIRFYGRRSAWTMIREANKAVISTDGRVRTGQKIVLP